MKNKWTRWIPFATYKWDYNDSVVFVRGNKKTGILQFKIVKIRKSIFKDPIPKDVIPQNIIDVKKAWDTVIYLIN